MRLKLEYDFSVQRLNRPATKGFASVLFALVILGLMLPATAGAQVNGMPASVTSPGFGGRQVNGTPPSVTSLGPRGYTPASPTCCFKGTSPGHPHFVPNPDSPLNVHHRNHDRSLNWGGVYAAPYYGYYDSADDPANDPAADQYNGGPTIFDRRGSGVPPAPSSAPYPRRPRNDYSQSDAASDSGAQTEAESDQPQTVLVFKDGHQVEVANYAIVGSTLYDLTGGTSPEDRSRRP